MFPRAPVVRQLREDAPDPAAGIGLVAAVAGNQMDMQVHHGLGRRHADIYADVEAVRPVLRGQVIGCQPKRLPDLGDLVGGGLEQPGEVPFENDQGMAGRDWIGVPDGQRQGRFGHDALGGNAAEWAGFPVQAHSSVQLVRYFLTEFLMEGEASSPGRASIEQGRWLPLKRGEC